MILISCYGAQPPVASPCCLALARILTQTLGHHTGPNLLAVAPPHIYCVAKGKEHKKYEFGTKASVAMTKTHSVIVAAVAHERNLYDAHTLPEVLDQAEAITDTRAARAIVDRGYRGRKFVDGTEVLVPGRAPRAQSRAKSAIHSISYKRLPQAQRKPRQGHSGRRASHSPICMSSAGIGARNTTGGLPRRG